MDGGLRRAAAAQIKRMEMEARSFSPDKSRALLQKVKEFKADHAALKTDAKKVVHANPRLQAITSCCWRGELSSELFGRRRAYVVQVA